MAVEEARKEQAAQPAKFPPRLHPRHRRHERHSLAARRRDADLQARTFADLALGFRHERVPRGELAEVGQDGPDRVGWRVDLDFCSEFCSEFIRSNVDATAK